jgi:hypothetical protein
MSMSADEMIAVIQAHKEGKQIQCQLNNVSRRIIRWEDVDKPTWDFDTFRYRIKPAEPKKVKMLCWFDGGVLVWRDSRLPVPGNWIRIPSEDKEIEIPGE